MECSQYKREILDDIMAKRRDKRYMFRNLEVKERTGLQRV